MAFDGVISRGAAAPMMPEQASNALMKPPKRGGTRPLPSIKVKPPAVLPKAPPRQDSYPARFPMARLADSYPAYSAAVVAMDRLVD